VSEIDGIVTTDHDGFGMAEAGEPEIERLTEYVPAGPVSQTYINATDNTCFLMGPVGGGKTTAVAFKRVADGAEQGVACDGWVRDRCLVLRKTWRVAKVTVLESWLEWFPKDMPNSSWVGGEDRPATHTLRFEDPRRGVKIELETMFAGLNDHRIEEVMRGFPASRIWLNEVDQFSKDIVTVCEERVGRYPKKDTLAEGQRRTSQVLGDFNAPDKTNYLFELLVEQPTAGRRLYEQPPGLIVEWGADGTLASWRNNPEAENLSRLDDDYYTKKARDWEEWRVRRFILNQWGYSRDGLPVFLQQFVERLNVAPHPIEPDRNLGLLIGVDFSTGGLRPAAVFMQPTSLGELRVVEGVEPGHGTGATRFSEMVNAVIETRYRGVPWIEVYADPASQYGADREQGQLTACEILSTVLGIPVRMPAGGSQEIQLRLSAIGSALKKVIDGERRRLVINPAYKAMIQALASGYCFRRRPPGSPTDWEPIPVKNEASDRVDAMGYGIIGFDKLQPTNVARNDRQQGERIAGAWSGGRGGQWGAPRLERPPGWQRPSDFNVFDL
jgi:hypothetical protein